MCAKFPPHNVSKYDQREQKKFACCCSKDFYRILPRNKTQKPREGTGEIKAP